MAKPSKFEDLTKDELIRSAIEDFAIDLSDDEKGTKRNIIAAFVESSIFWDDYVSQHPEVAPEPVVPAAVITSNAPTHGVAGEGVTTGEVTVNSDVEPVIHVATPLADQPVALTDQFLLKMVRDNELFQTRGYEFTAEHPYALVSATDAQWILENEDGFRQAFPQELAEFYG